MRAKIIFIVSSERSGSNLLRKMLANHTCVTGPKAPHILNTFCSAPLPREVFADGLSRKVIFELMKAVVNCRLHDWRLDQEFEAIDATYRPTSMIDFFNAFYHTFQTTHPTEWVVCKENNLWDFYGELQAFYGDRARWIYLYRDPRDVVASWMHVPLGLRTARSAAKRWNEEQESCWKLTSNSQNRFLHVAYEQLIKHPESEVARILHAIGLTPEASCAHPEWNQPEDGTTANVYWKNLDKPVLRNNSGKYRTLFDAPTLFQIQREVASSARQLGYHVRSENPLVNGLGWVAYLWQRNFGRFQQRKVNLHDDYTVELVGERLQLTKNVQQKLADLADVHTSTNTHSLAGRQP